MSDLAVALRVTASFALRAASDGLDTLGHSLVGRFAALNVSTAALFGGALLLDRALAKRTRASWRLGLYLPVALRVVMPLHWSLHVSGAPRADLLLAPLLVATRAQPEDATARGSALFALGAALYLGVSALLAIRAVTARVRLDRALDGARAIPAPAPGAPCPVLVHDRLGPMAVGVVAPRIVLPRRLLAPGEEHALACVLRHEAAHLKRGDAWLAAAMQVLAILAWPVAPLWLAFSRVRHLMELACDEAALDGADASERRRYGHALLDMAEWRSLGVAPVAGELHFGSTLRARIEALASQRHWPVALQGVALSLAPIALLAACGGASGPKTGAVGEKLDDGYGYQFDVDSAKSAASPDAPPARNADGRVAPEAIQAVVRANFGSFKRCYEAGLARDPKLAGTVTVKYAFGENGKTTHVEDDHSTMPDPQVVACVVAGFANLTYPSPGPGGEVTVVYPVEFAP